jgi:hypothetical protein
VNTFLTNPLTEDPMRKTQSDETPEYIREAARRAAAEAPPLVPGSDLWNHLAAIIASVPAPARQAPAAGEDSL